MNKFRTYFVMVILLISLPFMTACQPEVVVQETPQSSEASRAAADVTSDAPLNSDATNQSVVQSLTAGKGGSEPNPDSDFAKLTPVEQQGLIDWLNQVGSSYERITQAFEVFNQEAVAGVEGEALSASETFSTLRNTVKQEVEQMDNLSLDQVPASAQNIVDAVRSLNTWYLSFLDELAGLNPQKSEDLAKIDAGLSEATQKMQNLIDQIVAFSS